MMADWSKIKAEYIRDSSTSYRKLANKYEVSFHMLCKIARREEWTKLRRQRVDKQTKRMVDACATQEAKKAVKVNDLADVLLDKLQAFIGQVEPEDIEALTLASNVLYRIKETKKGLNAADVREQEARIAKLEREAKGEDAQSGVIQIVMPAEAEDYCV